MWLDDLQLVDTETGAARHVALELAWGRVVRITDAAPRTAETLSLGGAFVLPGLIACHTHLQASYPYSIRDPNEDPGVTFRRAAAQARRTLRAL